MSQIEKNKRQAIQQIAEVKRSLWAIENALKYHMPATLLVTSAAQGEGKSLFAASLAAAAASTGKYRVALLDLNWYRPSIHRFFDLERIHSTQDLFQGELTDLTVRSVKDSLDILTAPHDYVDQARHDLQFGPLVEGLIHQARQSYDLIVIDSAAVFPTNRMMMDPVMLSGVVDGVVLVVLTALTPKQQVKKALITLEATGARLLGVIRNQGISMITA